jgi:aryl-alcohol dehydrogenase-like predicted oxidoreductase
MTDELKRRDFLRRISGGAAALGLGRLTVAADADSDTARAPSLQAKDDLSIRDLYRRTLGRTDIKVPPLSIGLAPMGHAFYKPREYEPVVHAAIDAGITYLDLAPNYDVAEERLAPVMARRRDEVFLVSKTEAPSRNGTLRLIEQSLRRMQTDRLDLCHLHNVGQWTARQILGKGGMLEGIQAAKDRGLVRFIGASGHQRADRFVPVLETGQIDVLMVVMNFVDRYVYNFEERLLPTARKHQMGIVAMKVLAGVQGGWGGYGKRNPGRLTGGDHLYAFRYALSIPGVSTLVVGMKSLDELKQAILAIRNHKPLCTEEEAMLAKRGKALAADWGNHFGPA